MERKPSLHTTIAGINLSSPIYNASGCLCTSDIELNNLINSNSSAILTKSSTINSREGNEHPRFYIGSNYSINSMGIPNQGFKHYIDYYKSYIMMNQNNQTKPYIQSLYPFNKVELIEMFDYINNNLDMANIMIPYLIELNVSCPNVNNSVMLDKIEEYLDTIKQNNSQNIKIGLKLQPYYLRYEFDIVSNLLLKYKDHIKYIVSINSVINGLDIDIINESLRIAPNNGLGGIGGDPALPVALSNVYQFSSRLHEKIDIVGCGGVSNGNDVFKYLLVGAKAVQVGTELIRSGTKCFEIINNELSDLMQNKGYKKIEYFRNKLISNF